MAGETRYEVWTAEESSDGWSGPSEFSSDGADPEAVKDDLNVQLEQSTNEYYDPEMPSEADLGPAVAVPDLSKVTAFADDEFEGFPFPGSGPGWMATGKYDRLDTYFVWRKS
jgi:hypothetical protein